MNLTNEQKRFVCDEIAKMQLEKEQKVRSGRLGYPDNPKLTTWDLPQFAYFDNKWYGLEKSYLLKGDFVSRELERGRWTKTIVIPGCLEAYEEKYPYSGIETAKKCFGAYDKSQILNMTLRYMNKYIEMPQLEQVAKTCPQVVKDLLLNNQTQDDKAFSTSFKRGKNMKEITGMPDWLWRKLAGYDYITVQIWNNMRIWYKDSIKEGKPLTPEEIDKILNFKNSIKEIRMTVKNAKDANGKKLFTIDSLCNYLRRVDMYQAIPDYEAITILNDYIRMCNQLEIEPLTDSNSLKREHDVTVRTYNNWRQENISKIEKEGFAKRFGELSKYAYTNGKLTVCVPKEPGDMINEGKMNRNCVGCYTTNYANGYSTVFFIRKNDDLDHSYITIETDKAGENVRQAYYACNRKIDSTSDLNFINSWIKHNREVNATA